MVPQAAWREPCLHARQYKIRFPDRESFEAAAAQESVDFPSPVANPKRLYRTLVLSSLQACKKGSLGRLDRHAEFLAGEYGAEIELDARYALESPPWLSFSRWGRSPSLDHVLEAIGAREAWRHGNRGEGAVIAVVDSGIDGSRREFPSWKRRGAWQVQGARPFVDPSGHGTLCAVIAAGNRDDGARFEGVAPRAGLIAGRTRFFDSELTAIYDYLIALVEEDPAIRLIATNSFGRRSGSEPKPLAGDFPQALEEAIAHGIAVFVSAGNNHDLAGGFPADCHPATVWAYKLSPKVFTVGACDLDGQMWGYSSRGPVGSGKPDVVAPTPRNGLVAFGGEDRRFPEGWGTSGACPQAAGLAALLWTAEPSLTVEQLFARIRRGARDLGLPWTCQGAGQLDCAASLARTGTMEGGG